MIIEVPNAADFEQTGLDYLNLAADQAFSLLTDFMYAGYEASWENEIREFWRAAQRQLASALALVEQGAQFMLKARIAEIVHFFLSLELHGNGPGVSIPATCLSLSFGPWMLRISCAFTTR
jgi:hypothetical protein